MARINTNVASLTAQRGLSRSNATLNSTLQRLSSGLKINRGADDPAGLIASENLRSEISGITQAIDNSARASNVIATAEGALSEVAALLLNIKDLIVEAANSGALSQAEIEANQLQIDSAVDSITRISNTTTFAGLKLIDGSLGYITSGVDQSIITSLNLQQVNFGTQSVFPVKIDVVASAKMAELEYRNSAISQSVTLEIAGNEGVDILSFTSGTAASAIAFAVNRISDSTGINAVYINSANPSSGIVFQSASYGSKSYVSIRAQSGEFNVVNTDGATVQRATGVDVTATVNGALTVGDGRTLKLNTTSLDMEMTLDKNFGLGQTEFTITGGGALFQLGPKVTTNQQVNIAIQSVAASKLGDDETGFLNEIVTGGPHSLVAGNPDQASRIVEKAIQQVAVLRGRLGAFEKNTLDTNRNSLQITLENVTASESNIRDADFAAETSALTRAQILTQAGTSVLAQANSTPQSVLSLLQ